MSAIKNRIMFSDKLGLRSTPLNVSYVIVNTRLLKMELAYLCSRFQMPVGPGKSHHQKRGPDNSRFISLFAPAVQICRFFREA